MADLEGLFPLDPLHMPHNVAPIHAVAAARPGLPQVACFDTAFHHTLPREARWFGLPRALEAEGVRRYGFHGLSYEFIAGRLETDLRALAQGRVVVAHLGSGASLCALKAGRSIATTMGFSTLDGLLMATRCGSLDPGVILYLGRQGRSLSEIEDMLYHRSGLVGVSGLSGDVRALLASSDPHAAEAIDLFALSHRRRDGGTGQRARRPRRSRLHGGHRRECTGDPLGRLRPARLARPAARRRRQCGKRLERISASDSAIEVLVIPTDEEAVIARHTRATVWPSVA